MTFGAMAVCGGFDFAISICGTYVEVCTIQKRDYAIVYSKSIFEMKKNEDSYLFFYVLVKMKPNTF